MEKYQAMHVRFIHLNEEKKHEHWDFQTPSTNTA
jgi:hypothetical protein